MPSIFLHIYSFRTDQKSKVFDLFRLLMQYHDPELCTYMESLRIKPQQYVTSWFRTLLAKDTDLQLCWSVWDHYFEKVKSFHVIARLEKSPTKLPQRPKSHQADFFYRLRLP